MNGEDGKSENYVFIVNAKKRIVNKQQQQKIKACVRYFHQFFILFTK